MTFFHFTKQQLDQASDAEAASVLLNPRGRRRRGGGGDGGDNGALCRAAGGGGPPSAARWPLSTVAVFELLATGIALMALSAGDDADAASGEAMSGALDGALER